MSARDIQVLVVDDSPLMREVISDVINAASGMTVVGTANDGRQALEQAERLEPDVVTLDVQMPGMDGLAALDNLLQRSPRPVIMVSSLCQRGANVTLDALDRGALDYVAKPEGKAGIEDALRDELVRKIRAVAGIDVRRVMEIRRQRSARQAARVQRGDVTPPEPSVDVELCLADKCLAIGISTGGPPALALLFGELTGPMPPIVVVQHMPAQFTNAFAWRLDSNSKLSVKEAAQDDVLRPNHVYIAPGGKHLEIVQDRARRTVTTRISDGPPVSSHKPSVDVMMRSVAEVYGNRSVGVIMTGMGRDGADGCGLIRAAGGYVFGQDEATSDVYGMNKVAFVEGHVDRQFALQDGARILTQQVARMWIRRAPAAVS